MIRRKEFIVLLVCTFCVVSIKALPKNEEEKKDRVVDRDLSDKEHYAEDHHNTQYDHEAFLGEEEAKAFEHLTPAESKRRLGVLVDRIDKNGDGFVSRDELREWIHITQKNYIQQDVQRQWIHVNQANDTTISWETYRKLVYGYSDDFEQHSIDTNDPNIGTYEAMVHRDRRRWQTADIDQDDQLNWSEFKDFLHPEESNHMRDIIVQETLEDIDKDKDGRVSLEEYIGDMYKAPEERDEGEKEPDWVETERQQFKNYRDKNGNGYMEGDEVTSWILPEEFDHAEAESRHLIIEADSDADEQLTKEEILSKYDLFVGSQATDFGEALTRHDEF